MLVFALIYYVTPDVKQRGFRWLTPGAVVGVLLWLVASFGVLRLRLRVADVGAFYGAFAGAIVLVAWLWLTTSRCSSAPSSTPRSNASGAQRRRAARRDAQSPLPRPIRTAPSLTSTTRQSYAKVIPSPDARPDSRGDEGSYARRQQQPRTRPGAAPQRPRAPRSKLAAV